MAPLVDAPRCDVLVLGGGPAGMAAGLAAAEVGARVVLVDERPALGGQVYKRVSAEFHVLDERLQGQHYHRGGRMITAVQASGIEVLTDTIVWSIVGHDALLCRHDAEVRRVSAAAVVIAAGAYDRPVPFPGWTLPGVTTAGGAQSLAKVYGVAPGRRILMAGSGPLSLSFAAELHHLGANVVMLTEASPRPTAAAAARLIAAGPGTWSALWEGAAYLGRLRRHGIPVRWSTIIRRAEGHGRVERAVIARVDRDWRPVPGSEDRVEVDAVCLGYGLLPSNELTRLCGCAHEYDEQRGGLIPRRDTWMRTSVPGVFAVGDCAGISGAAAAVEEGRLAGLAAAVDAGRLTMERAGRLAQGPRVRLRQLHRFRAALDRMYPIGPGVYDLADEHTIVCRCEEVTLGDIAAALRRGSTDAHGVKAATRAGMGLCQGRVCGRQVMAEVARAGRARVGSVTSWSIRPPVKPIPIGAVAAPMPERRRPIVALDPPR